VTLPRIAPTFSCSWPTWPRPPFPPRKSSRRKVLFFVLRHPHQPAAEPPKVHTGARERDNPNECTHLERHGLSVPRRNERPLPSIRDLGAWPWAAVTNALVLNTSSKGRRYVPPAGLGVEKSSGDAACPERARSVNWWDCFGIDGARPSSTPNDVCVRILKSMLGIKTTKDVPRFREFGPTWGDGPSRLGVGFASRTTRRILVC